MSENRNFVGKLVASTQKNNFLTRKNAITIKLYSIRKTIQPVFADVGYILKKRRKLQSLIIHCLIECFFFEIPNDRKLSIENNCFQEAL